MSRDEFIAFLVKGDVYSILFNYHKEVSKVILSPVEFRLLYSKGLNKAAFENITHNSPMRKQDFAYFMSTDFQDHVVKKYMTKFEVNILHDGKGNILRYV